MLGLMRRTFGPKDLVAIKTAFNALVRPILEYACPVWNPYLVKHIHSIESIQRRATLLICGSDKPYSERLIELNWYHIIGASKEIPRLASALQDNSWLF